MANTIISGNGSNGNAPSGFFAGNPDITENGVLFEELPGSPTYRFDATSQSATRRFRIQDGDLQAFIFQAMGYAQLVQSPNVVSITQPIAFPQNIGTNTPPPSQLNLISSYLFCDSVSAKPFEGENGVNDANAADGPISGLLSGVLRYPKGGTEVICEYRQNFGNYQGDQFPGTSLSSVPTIPAGTFLTYSQHMGCEYFTVPGRTWQWDTAGTPLPASVSVGIYDPTGTTTVTWHRVPYPPWSTIKAALGTVNQNTWFGVAPECSLFTGLSTVMAFRINTDVILWTLAMTFSEREHQIETVLDPATYGSVGWNHFYNPDAVDDLGNRWQRIIDPQSTLSPQASPYALTDFSQMFQLTQAS